MKLNRLLWISNIASLYYSFNIEYHLGTKSPYKVPNTVKEVTPPKGCHLIQVHLVSRHGSRNPSKSDIQAFNIFEKKLNTITYDLHPNFNHLKHWKNPYNIKDEGLLNNKGESDLYLLGKRDQLRYKTLFQTKKYSSNNYKFASSSVSRSGQSAMAYGLGLFSEQGCLGPNKVQPVYIETLPKDNDSRLEIKKACPKWLKEVEDNIIMLKEYENFKDSHIKPITTSIFKLSKLNVTAEEVITIYKLCSFEVSLNSNSQNFCKLLNSQQLLDLEYLDDIEEYYTYGKAFKINELMASDLLNYIVKKIQSSVEGEEQIIGTFQFGHSETILLLSSTLDLFNSRYNLTSTLSPSQRDQRSFKTSLIAPFGSNYHFEVYQCNQTIKIRTLLNEVPIKLPKCQSLYCALDELKDGYKEALQNNFKNYCQI